jgi:hypothetical protein
VRTFIFLSLLLMNSLSANEQIKCEQLDNFSYSKMEESLTKISDLKGLLAESDCYNDNGLCDAILMMIVKMMKYTDRIFDASIKNIDGNKCRKCNMDLLVNYALEADNIIKDLESIGMSYNGPNYLARYQEKIINTKLCEDTSSYAYQDKVYRTKRKRAGKTLIVGKIKIRPRPAPMDKLVITDCEELKRQIANGASIGPNYCGLISENIPYKPNSNQKEVNSSLNNKIPDKPDWKKGCVEDNSKNTDGVKAIWKQCYLSLCSRTRLICSDSSNNLWRTYGFNNWEYVTNITLGKKRYAYPSQDFVDVINSENKKETYHGRLEGIPQ